MKHAKARIAAGVLAVSALIPLTACSTMNQEWHRDCRIDAKDTLYGGDGKSTTREYRLSTSCGTFTVGDSLAGGFNSWDTWAAFKVGKSYDIKTGGYRAGLFNQFPTVLETKEVKH